MHRSARTAQRVLLALVLVASLVLAGSVPVAAYVPPADHVTGQTGHHDFRDHAYGSHDASVDCLYHTVGDVRQITGFVVRAPLVWWPDTDSAQTHEHGTVGWRFRLQRSFHRGHGPWSTVFTSKVQKRTAHEDHPLNDVADKAPFTGRSLAWSSNADVSYRVKVTVTWYSTDGSVLGTATHWYYLYEPSDVQGPVAGYCGNKLAVIV